MKQKITTYGDPILRIKAKQVENIDADVHTLIDDMLETMYAGNGIGLAAEQVGRDESVCIIDIPQKADLDADGHPRNSGLEMPMVLINPELVEASLEQATAEEGCLSFPEIYAPVTRPSEITVKYLDRKGTQRQQKLRGLPARAVQHEMDHLEGILIVDRMSTVKKVALSGRLKRLKKRTQADLSAQ